MTRQTEAQLYHERIVAAVERIVTALDGLSDAEIAWTPPAPETNSLAVLATHLLGNLQENIVYQFGGQPLERDRDAEFAVSGASAAVLQRRWAQRKAEVAAVFAHLAPAALDAAYTRPQTGEVVTGRTLLLITAIHAGEHAGHAELTRALVRAHGQR